MGDSAVQVEVDRIKQMYRDRDHNPVVREMWAPFSEDEVNHRVQQYIAFSTLFRNTGRSGLEGMRILDVGCGTGRMLRSCLDLGASPEDLSGVDLHANAIATARRLSPHIDFRVSNGTQLDFPDREFDLVMQFVVFSSIFEDALRRMLAQEMMRVLKPGGFLFWWDLHATVSKTAKEPLDPRAFFPELQMNSIETGPRPKPSFGLTPRRLLKPVAIGADLFAQPATHTAALMGPKS